VEAREIKGRSQDFQKWAFLDNTALVIVDLSSPPRIREVPDVFADGNSSPFELDCKFSSDGRYLVYKNFDALARLSWNDQSLQIYDLNTNEHWTISEQASSSRRSAMYSVAEEDFWFSPSDGLLAFSERKFGSVMTVYDISQRKTLLRILCGKVRSAQFSLDGKLLVIGSMDPSCIQWWTLDGKLLHVFYLYAAPQRLFFLENGTLHVRTTTSHGDDFVDLSLYFAAPHPPASWERRSLPPNLSAVTGAAAGSYNPTSNNDGDDDVVAAEGGDGDGGHGGGDSGGDAESDSADDGGDGDGDGSNKFSFD